MKDIVERKWDKKDKLGGYYNIQERKLNGETREVAARME